MADRAHTLGLLQRELAAARDAREDGYATELEARIERLSQGSGVSPATEKTSAARPGRRGSSGTR